MEKIGDYMAISGGVNYFMMAHAVTFKLQIGAQKEPRFVPASGANPAVIVKKFAPMGVFQAQLVM